MSKMKAETMTPHGKSASYTLHFHDFAALWWL